MNNLPKPIKTIRIMEKIVLSKEEKQALFALLREILRIFVEEIVSNIKKKKEEKKNGKTM